MDMIDHFELPRESAEALFDVYITWYEDFESGFAEGLYENEPDEDDRIAYEFATGQRGDPDAAIVRVPWHAAVAIEAGVSSHLEDLDSGLADGTYDEDVTPEAREACKHLSGMIEALEAEGAPLGVASN